jgi:hypothetical protein
MDDGFGAGLCVVILDHGMRSFLQRMVERFQFTPNGVGCQFCNFAVSLGFKEEAI